MSNHRYEQLKPLNKQSTISIVIFFYLLLENSFIHEKKGTTKLKWDVEEENEKETEIDDVDADAEQKYIYIFYITYIQT